MNLIQKIESQMRVVEDFPAKGISFKDFSPIFQNPELSNEIIKHIADRVRGKVDIVCGIESRGFIFGFPLALELNLPFVMVRKQGKLPPPVVSVSYDLEYGSSCLEIVENQIPKGARVLIHDDVLATGGTAAATAELIKRVNAIPAYFSFLIELNFLHGRDKLNIDTDIHALISYNS